MNRQFLLALAVGLAGALSSVFAANADFTCSDPFIVRDDKAGVYRLYHNVPRRTPSDAYVVMQTSKDLVKWSDPVSVLELPQRLNCDSLWAPEVHQYNGKWYLFGTIHKPTDPKNLLPILVTDPQFNKDKSSRRKTYLATWTFVSDSPCGPFRPFADHAITPENWSSLDGTLYVEDGRPYMVFCHEWTQLRDGTMEAVELAPDLSRAVGKPFTLFRASALWEPGHAERNPKATYVTDGPFFYRSKTGKLLMLWSTGKKGYVQVVSRSESGRLEGPWTHHEIIRENDSGHGMVFKTFDGRLALAIHSPNFPHLSKRVRVFEVEDLGDTLRVGRQIGGELDAPMSNIWIEPTPVTVKVDVDHPTHDISKHMYGLFLEDISQSVDGCFYPELVWNRGFEFPPSPTVAEPKFQEKGVKLDEICGWKPDCRFGSAGRFTLLCVDPAFTNTPAYLRMEAFARGAGMRNTGAMDEMSVARGVPLDLSVWARGVPFEVRLEDASNRVLAAASFVPVSSWGRHTASFKPSASCRKAHLFIMPKTAGVLDVDQVSLMPHERFKGHANGLRTDIATLFADLKPSTFRFPGGCMLEGDSFASWWDWKRTVGPIEERRPIWNIWGYYQTLGLGYYEYLQFCEDVGAEPVPVFLAGLTCQFRGPKFAPLESLGEFVTNVLDGIEFARGGIDTKWGAVRASMGHPAPFRLTYVALGNENWGTEYWERYNVIQKAVKSAHPDLKIVAAVDPHAYMRRKDWEFSWKNISSENADVADEHMYASPSWWLNHTTMYDSYPRKGVDVYVGEWATRHASDAYINSLYNAVAEAAFRMGFERNADLVKMTAYAPLIRRVGVPGNRYSLIQLDGLGSCGAPAYWCEKMFADNRPDRLVPCSYPVRKALQPAGIDRPKWSYNPTSQPMEVVSFHAVAGVKGDELILKFANAARRPQPVTLDFGRKLPACSANRTVLTGAPNAKNLPSDPRRVLPRTAAVQFGGGATYSCELPACSVTVLRLKTR